MRSIKTSVCEAFVFLTVCIAFIFFSFSALGTEESVSVFISGECNRKNAFALVEKINNEREKDGKALLSADKELFEAAEQRAAEIAVNYSHVRPCKKPFYSVLKKNAAVTAENIAFGKNTAEEVLEEWLSSPGERASLCSGSLKRIGVACLKTPDGGVWWVQLSDSLEDAESVKAKNGKRRFEVETAAENLKLTAELERSRMTAEQKNELKIYTMNIGTPGQKTLLERECFSFSFEPDIAAEKDGFVIAHGTGDTLLTVAHKERPALSVQCFLKITRCKTHEFKTQKAVLPTCTKSGLTEGKSCVHCKTVVKAQKTVAAKGHSFSKPSVAKKATYSSPGVRVYTCSVCGKRMKESIPVLPLSKPVGLKGSKQTEKSLRLSWKKVKGASEYEIYMKAPGSPWRKKATTQKTTLGINRLTAGTEYYFRVKAVCKNNSGEFSSALKTAAAPTSPQARASSKRPGELCVTWKESFGAGGYIVYYSTDRSFKKHVKKKAVKAGAKTVTFTSLEEGRTYYIRVTAYKNVDGKRLMSRRGSSLKVQTLKRPLQRAQTVYVTKTGERFHRKGCSSLKKSRYAMTRSAAVKKGYSPCRRCKP